jgi:hypothetical protein
MSDLIATIFHISDMHLLVDEQGETRDDTLLTARLLARLARDAPVRSIRDLCAGVMWHDAVALKALARTLAELSDRLREESTGQVGPVAVLQGGDVEARGVQPARASLATRRSRHSGTYTSNCERSTRRGTGWISSATTTRGPVRFQS